VHLSNSQRTNNRWRASLNRQDPGEQNASRTVP
jgi:hypothetical protein